MKKIRLIIALTLASTSAFAGGDPSSLKVKVYAVYASLSSLCTNPVQVFLNTGTYVDFLAGPTLGGGDLPDGTYQCVIIKMSDTLKHTPKTTATTCIAGTEYTGDVCQTSQGATNLDGSAITCTTNVDDTVYMYMTTDSAASTGSRAFELPLVAGDGKGIKLASPLVISSTGSAKFVVNATGAVVAGSGTCGINAPAFSFVKL